MIETMLTRNQSREVDRLATEQYKIPSIVLMENAARSVVDVLVNEVGFNANRDCIVVCGKGNNGGDGLAVARWLCNMTKNIRVLLTDPPEAFRGDAAVQLEIVKALRLAIEPADGFLSGKRKFGGLVVDAVYGTGFRPPSKIDFRPLNARIKEGGGVVVSIDLPSGMDADTGEVSDDNAVRATWTVTMGTPKVGFAKAKPWFLGNVRTAPLGVPKFVIELASRSPP